MAAVDGGPPRQIFAGIVIAFSDTLLFVRKRPYADKGVRQVGFTGTVVLVFLFLLLALMIATGSSPGPARSYRLGPAAARFSTRWLL